MKIFAEQLEYQGHHGVYDEERRDGRTFRVDLEVEVDDESSARSDELDETLDYRRLAGIVDEVIGGASRFLVEKLAGDIADKTLQRHAAVRQVNVRIRKHAPDVVGTPKWVGVELTRRRDDG